MYCGIFLQTEDIGATFLQIGQYRVFAILFGGTVKSHNVVGERELKAYPYHRINTVGSGKGHTNKIACYSKFPILSSRILDYPSEYNGSVLYEIKIGEDTVTLINNHLESNKLTKADKVVYEDMLKSPEKEKVKSGARLLIRKLAEASAIRAPQADTIAHEIAAYNNVRMR